MSSSNLLELLSNHLSPPTKATSVEMDSPSLAIGNEPAFIGSIDQGTTSTRFLIFNREGEPVVSHQVEFKQYYPQPGYVVTSKLFYADSS
jgi:hypothetical protein